MFHLISVGVTLMIELLRMDQTKISGTEQQNHSLSLYKEQISYHTAKNTNDKRI